jgi:hypothetical protein
VSFTKSLLTVATTATACLSMVVVSPALAATGFQVCVPGKQDAVLRTPRAGACKSGFTKAALLPEADTAAISEILPYIKYVPSGVDGKPTIIFSGVNVEINSGAGKTNAAVNGEGNLVIGYDEDSGAERGHPGAQSGSNNLVLGEEQEFTSYAGIVGGRINSARAPFASVLDGGENIASGIESVVLGGVYNHATWYEATVGGGADNTAAATESTVSGGEFNTALASGAAIGGGRFNVAEGGGGWIGGGYKNKVGAVYSSIFGGEELTTSKEFEAIP